MATRNPGACASWSFRAPGTTRVSLSEAAGKSASPDQFKAALNVESSDPDALMTWLQGRGDVGYRSQKPLRLRGDVTIAPGGYDIDAMKAEIDGGAVEGRVAVSHRDAGSGSKISAQLKAERLDLDAATALRGRWRARRPNGRTKGSSARHRPRHYGRSGVAAAGGAGSAMARRCSRSTS